MLPGIGFSELFLLALAALIIIGPRDLPMMMRRIGQFVGKGRRMANEFRAAFDDIARQSELDDLRKEIEALKRGNALTEAREELETYADEVNRSVIKKTGGEGGGPS